MKQNPILYILLAILIAQPLMVVGFGPAIGADSVTPTESVALSQGTRLDTHTNHVPILIDGTADFSDQGWPGTGASDDPYVISGLNITYDLGVPLISIFNTDAYFVISDCYLNQLSVENAVHLENTTHARMEYVTIVAWDTGIYTMNTPNTDLLFLDVYAFDYALQFLDSDDSSLQHSLMNTTDYRCIRANNSNFFTMYNNDVQSSNAWYAIIIAYSLYFGSSLDTVYDGWAGIRLEWSNYSSITQLTAEGKHGVYYKYSTDSNLTASTLNGTTWDGVRVYYSDSIRICDSTITGVLYGVSGFHSNNTYVANNEIHETGDDGIYLEYSYDCDLIGNTITDVIAGNGIQADNADGLSMDLNVVERTPDTAVYILNSHDVDMVNNTISDISATAVEFDTCNNSIIGDNNITGADVGLQIYGGYFTDVFGNVVTDIMDEGIAADTHHDIEVYENTVTNATTGLYFTTCDRSDIRDNIISDVDVGIHADVSVNSTFHSNEIYGCTEKGINLWGVDTSEFSENLISDMPDIGIYIAQCEYNDFTDNELVNSGFLFALDGSFQDYNHTFSGNNVTGMPVYYAINTDSLNLQGNDWGQILLVNCSYGTITGGSFAESTNAISMYYCDEMDLFEVYASDLFSPIIIQYSTNTTIVDAVVENCPAGGEPGIYVKNTIRTSFDNLTISNMGVDGISFMGGTNFTIRDSNFQDISESGIFGSGIDFGFIFDSTFWNVTEGISLTSYSETWNITNNVFEFCDYGIHALNTYTDFATILANEMYSCGYGVYQHAGDYWYIYNNTILWSENYGIILDSNAVNNPTIAYNVLGLSGSDNGYDERLQNWDDGVATGNWWADYDGSPGSYLIPGSGAATDRYPMQYIVTEPIINNKLDISYAEGSEGNEITWLPFDDYFNNFEVTIDGVLWFTDAVNHISTPEITVNVDGLAYGDHALVITVIDMDMNNVTDTLTIHVFDDTPPTIDNPPNIESFEGLVDQEITWVVDDLNPGTYLLLMDEVEVATGNWTNGDLAYNIDSVPEGVHEFFMTIFDADGNAASDTVLVLVISDDDAPVIDSPDDLLFVEGTTGNRLIWTPSDSYPEVYSVSENNTLFISGDWGGSKIILDLDALPAGEYEFTLTVWDHTGNSVSDAVNVTVIPYAGWSAEIPFDFGIVLIIGAVVGGAIVVIGLVYYIKVKKPQAGGA